MAGWSLDAGVGMTSWEAMRETIWAWRFLRSARIWEMRASAVFSRKKFLSTESCVAWRPEMEAVRMSLALVEAMTVLAEERPAWAISKRRPERGLW